MRVSIQRAIFLIYICTVSMSSSEKTRNEDASRISSSDTFRLKEFPVSAIPSPLLDVVDNSYPTKHVIYTDTCGFAVLNPTGDPKYTILSLLLMGRHRYDATVAWYVLGKTCARPIYLRVFSDCHTNEQFGMCTSKSPGWWDIGYAKTAYIDRDELTLVLAAPAPELGGLYTRLIIINGEPISSDILLTIEGTCSFSLKGPIDDRLCKPFNFFVNGTTLDIGMFPARTPRPHEENVKQWLTRQSGKLDTVIGEASMRHAADLPRAFRDSYLKSPKDNLPDDPGRPTVSISSIHANDAYVGSTSLYDQSLRATEEPVLPSVDEARPALYTNAERNPRMQLIISAIVVASTVMVALIGISACIVRKCCKRKIKRGIPQRPSRKVYSRL
ncbi:glycoprotein D [Gallid alphaherpesvirus 3]|uniref:Glycoprotein D n=3 Tax=Alphaherpesvirinae TaxID=10293 RepID=Q786E9_9ALPH|nr:envelope glycoprotein D [Gallid alphaherpesvirus 3]YP_010795690.1 glycoprotein D [Gallid alphaherpesvirus 3]AAB50856.2 glycoprotein D like-protein [Marek's disease virus serotype 2 MDV2]BAA32019.1 glycoprotein homologue D [Gallid alphaherpesvirus 1]AEI00299.1 glycoprotein D [Gallid alphaherpesvirus 3]QEY02247.1 glycoprotein D [Gallid alphaherpesvirus 3]BAA32011.1 glycoprotein D [Marek's disease virus serotype 2 MDV2]